MTKKMEFPIVFLINILIGSLFYFHYNESTTTFFYMGDASQQYLPFLSMIRDCMTNDLTCLFDISHITGLGQSMTSYFYYGLSDIFTYISLLFKDIPSHDILAINLLGRILLSLNITYIWLRYNKFNCFNSLLGALLYSLSGNLIFTGFTFPTLVAIYPFYPLWLLAIDRLLSENKKKLISISVFLLILGNFQLAPSALFGGLIYYIFKILLDKQSARKTIFSFIFYSFLGIALSSIIIIPSIIDILSSARVENTFIDSMNTFLTIKGPQTIINLINGNDLGLTIIPLILIPTLFINKVLKEKKLAFTFLLAFIVFALFSNLAHFMFSGFIRSSTRYYFIFIPFIIYLALIGLDNIRRINVLTYIPIFIIVSIITISPYIFSFITNTSRLRITIINLLFLILISLLILIKKKFLSKIIKFSVLTLVICFYSIYFIQVESAHPRNQKEWINIFNNPDNFEKALIDLKNRDKSFYRIGYDENKTFMMNTGLYYSYESTGLYHSLINKHYQSFYHKHLNIPAGYDILTNSETISSRPFIQTFLSQKYLLTSKKDAPYGHSYLNTYDRTDYSNLYLYKNDYTLPIAYGYDNYITIDKLNNLKSYEKEQLLLDTSVVDGDIGIEGLPVFDYNPNFVKYSIEDFEIEFENCSIEDDKLIANEDYAKLKIKGDYKLLNRIINIYIEFENEEKKSINLRYDDILYSSNYNKGLNKINFSVGYVENKKKDFNIIFKEGTYNIKNIEIISFDSNEYQYSANNRLRFSGRNISVDGNDIYFTTNFKTPTIMQVTIPYSNNFKVLVDNEEIETFKVNYGFLGFKLDEGNHQIEVKYTNRPLYVGISISLLALIVLILLGKKIYLKSLFLIIITLFVVKYYMTNNSEDSIPAGGFDNQVDYGVFQEEKMSRYCNEDFKDYTTPNEVVVLAYHRVLSYNEKIKSTYDKFSHHAVLQSNFDEQMKYLKDNNYHTLTMDEFYGWQQYNCPIPPKSVLITFDDGHLSVYKFAFPVIKKYNLRATSFNISKWIAPYNMKWDPNRFLFMSYKQMNEMTPHFEFHSHSYDIHHINKEGIPYVHAKDNDFIENDVTMTRKSLSNSYYYAYPYGESNDQIIEIFKQNNIRMAFKYSPFRYATRLDDPYLIPRIEVNAYYTIDEFIDIVEGNYE